MRSVVSLAIVLVLAAPALGLASPSLPTAGPAAAPQPQAASATDVTIAGYGGTPLRATWFVPEGPGPFPVILRTHGWGQHREHVAEGIVARHLERGYAVLTYDSRGFGESGGLVHLNSPDAEAKDVPLLVDWIAAQPKVLLEAPGDPRIGMTGASYGGGLQLLAGVFEPRLDALAPEITWHDLRHSLAPHGVPKLGWITLLYAGGHVGAHLGTTDQSGSHLSPNAEGLDPILTAWFAEVLATNRVNEDLQGALAARSLAPYLDGLERFPPTMVYQGWKDTLFTPNEAVWTFEALRAKGFQACLMVHGGGHGYGTPDYDYVRTSVLDFLDYWVLETVAPVPPPIEVFQPWDAGWRSLGGWPDAADGGGTTYYFASASAAAGLVTPAPSGQLREAPAPGGTYALPSTVAPAGFREVPNFHPQVPLGPVDLPGTYALFATDAFDASRFLLGTPRMHLALRGPTPDATLFVELLDLGLDGEVVAVLGNQVTPLRVESGAEALQVVLELVAVGHELPAGHRLGVRLSASDNGHAASRLPLPVLLEADSRTTLTVPWAPAA